MSGNAWLLAGAFVFLVVLVQLGRALGRARGLQLGLAGGLVLGCGWVALEQLHAPGDREGPSAAGSVPSGACFKCHEPHHASWHRSYHRTMTREATPENVKGDFNGAAYTYMGITSHMTRDGDAFSMQTADPAWAERAARSGRPLTELGPAPLRKFRVDRLVGSHWFQEYMHRDGAGRYWRLPLSYHLVERRWVHTNGAFLAPDTEDFWSKSSVWNETCLFCHNTRPSKRPVPQGPGTRPGYRSEVAELGISCEACHGPGGEHVRVNHNPARRYAVRRGGAGDPTIVNPARLPADRSAEVCGHCHGSPVPRPEAWDLRTMTDPFTPGRDLRDFYTVFWSEAEQKDLYAGGAGGPPGARRPGPLDGRFWGDGTPLTTALEYQGMALSACYEGGRLSCLSCHTMHQGAPNFQLARGMDTNEACFQCHPSYRTRLTEHTHHPASSPGSLCYNCHMPYQVYSLLTTHRSHRIVSPRVADSLGTGKPHACNLCHLDRSLGWTRDWLGKWYGVAPEPLPEEEGRYSSALVHLFRGDARSRAVVAGAFSWPAAREASGADWAGPFLVRLLERERYPAVRYLAHRGLRVLYGRGAEPYDYLAPPAVRRARLAAVGARLDARCRPAPGAHPGLPLGPDGRPLDGPLNLLLRQRKDPDVFIHE